MHTRSPATRRRHIAQRRARALEEREPSLINLPIPLPIPIASIPILGPILSPLIDGLPWPTPTTATPISTSAAEVQPTTTPAAEPTTATPSVPTSIAAPAPQPSSTANAPSPTSPNGDSTGRSGLTSTGGGASSADDGSGSSGSVGGFVGSGVGGGGDSPSSGGSAGASEGAGSPGVASSSSGDGAGSNASGDSSGDGGDGGGSTVVVAGVSPGADPASDAGSPPSTAVAQGASAPSSSPSPSSAQAPAKPNAHEASGDAPAVLSGISVSTTGVAMAVANAYSGGPGALTNTYGFIAPSNTGAATAATGTVAGGGGSGASGSGSSDSNGGYGSSSSPGTTTSADTTSHHALSSGALAAIVVVAVLLFLVVTAVVVRRRAVKQRLRRRKNWFFGGQNTVYGNSAISSSRYFTDHPNGSAPHMSERSSFVAGASHASWETFDDHLAGPAAGIAPASDVDITVPPVGRQMQGLMHPVWTTHLNGSMVFAPSLADIAKSDALPTIRSPDRASWGSSNTYGDESSGEDGAWVTCPESVAVSSRSHGLPSSMSVRPFSPSDLWRFPKPPDDQRRSRTSAHMVSPDSALESSEYATAPENPFGDHASAEADAVTAESVDTETASHFARVETIRRPFVPALEDEIGVTPGERVRMLQRFADGWAYAEKVGTRQRGIIPIDCLRTAEEDLPAFLASKRLSSYRPPSALTSLEETGSSTIGVAV